MESLKIVLMNRDGLTSNDADERIDGARKLLNGYLANGDMESAERICEDEFGLEPDYLIELF